MVCAVEAAPHSLLDPKSITLHDLVVFELLLELDALDARLGTRWKPLCSTMDSKPVNLLADVAESEANEVFRLWQDAFEWSYYDDVLAGIAIQKNSVQ